MKTSIAEEIAHTLPDRIKSLIDGATPDIDAGIDEAIESDPDGKPKFRLGIAITIEPSPPGRQHGVAVALSFSTRKKYEDVFGMPNPDPNQPELEMGGGDK